jgi:hypothetical protein
MFSEGTDPQRTNETQGNEAQSSNAIKRSREIDQIIADSPLGNFDAWFITFAQHTVDRMLLRYGIASPEVAESEVAAYDNARIDIAA